MGSKRISRISVAVAALAIACGLAPTAGAATTSPCGKSFIDVDNNGVCSPGDVPLASVLAPLAKTDTNPNNGNSHEAYIDVRYAVAPETGPAVYTPPADGHPVGVVLGGSIVAGFASSLTIFATGNIRINGRLYGDDPVNVDIESCRGVSFGKGALFNEQGGYNEAWLMIAARADLCDDSTAPATLELGQSTHLLATSDLVLAGDNVRIDDHVVMRTQQDTYDYGQLFVESGNLAIGKSVSIAGPAISQVDFDNCGANASADHMRATIGSFFWEDQNEAGLCDATLHDGTPYNVEAFPQRITITNSTLKILDGGLGQIYTNGNGVDYPCDGLTLVKSKFLPADTWGLSPTPRINPTGPCTGTIPD